MITLISCIDCYQIYGCKEVGDDHGMVSLCKSCNFNEERKSCERESTDNHLTGVCPACLNKRRIKVQKFKKASKERMTTIAEWTGVIVVGPYELDCRLFSAFGRGKPFPIKFIHAKCHTTLGEILTEKEEKEKGVVAEELPTVQAREQLFCPKCQRPLKTDEVGQGVETESGIIEVSEAEITTLEFGLTKRVAAELIQADDSAIEAVGFGRRLYVLPKPAAVDVYASIYYTLRESRRIGFISPLVIKKKPNVAVIRPLTIPFVVFGQERPVLVLDVLNDTDRLKDPAELPDYPGSLPALNLAVLAQPIAEAQKITTRLDPERCVNPKRLRLKGIIKRAVERSLKR